MKTKFNKGDAVMVVCKPKDLAGIGILYADDRESLLDNPQIISRVNTHPYELKDDTSFG